MRVQDLMEAHPGRIMLRGERFLLVNAKAMGMLRSDLVSVLGRERAKGFLLRYGWSCGFHDALAVKQQLPDCTDQFWIEQGPQLHTLEGVVHAIPFQITLDRAGDLCYLEGLWLHSYEAEQHLQHFGLASEPVCWTLVGYAGGYTTGVFGRQVIYREVECAGKGDPHCRFVGQPTECWGEEIAADLTYYTEYKIAEELEEAHRRIHSQHEQLKRITSMHEQLSRLVLDGQGREAVVETVGRMLNAPVMVEDRHHRPLVWWLPPESGHEPADCLIGAALPGDSALRAQLQAITRERRTGDLVAAGSRAPARTTVPIVLDAEVVGYLSVIHGGGCDPELRRMVAERAAGVMGFVLLTERTALETEHRLRGELLDDLLTGGVSVDLLRNRARYMGQNLDQPHRFMLVEVAPHTAHGVGQEAVRRRLASLLEMAHGAVTRAQQSALAILRDEVVVLLVPSDARRPSLRQVAREVQQRFGPDRLTICISREACGVEQLVAAFSESRHALQVAARLGRSGVVFGVEEMRAFDLVYSSPARAELISYGHRLLDRVLAHDQENGGQLLLTLHAFLSCGGNLQRTAEQLSISISGLKYRLARLREVGQFQLNDPEVRFDLQLALRALVASGAVPAGLG